jgi:hypothetical protein
MSVLAAAGVALGESSRAMVRFRSRGPTVTIDSSGGGRVILLDVQADFSAKRGGCVEVEMDRDDRQAQLKLKGCQGIQGTLGRNRGLSGEHFWVLSTNPDIGKQPTAIGEPDNGQLYYSKAGSIYWRSQASYHDVRIPI